VPSGRIKAQTEVFCLRPAGWPSPAHDVPMWNTRSASVCQSDASIALQPPAPVKVQICPLNRLDIRRLARYLQSTPPLAWKRRTGAFSNASSSPRRSHRRRTSKDFRAAGRLALAGARRANVEHSLRECLSIRGKYPTSTTSTARASKGANLRLWHPLPPARPARRLLAVYTSIGLERANRRRSKRVES
jgi:hypothetical protein